jgi:hypothetical protein
MSNKLLQLYVVKGMTQAKHHEFEFKFNIQYSSFKSCIPLAAIRQLIFDPTATFSPILIPESAQKPLYIAPTSPDVSKRNHDE